MKVVSVKQPWATLITLGIKPIENRSWRTEYRGKLLIHSSAKPVVPDALSFNQKQLIETYRNKLVPDLFSCIIGEVNLVACVQNHKSIWAEPGLWHWVFESAIHYDNPVTNVKGSQSLWNWESENELPKFKF